MTMFAANTARITAAVTSTREAPNSWMARSLCRTLTPGGRALYDPDMWHPVATNMETGRAPKAICAACPVQTTCLQYADDHHIADGIYGGLDPAERKNLARRRYRANARAAAANNETETAA